MVPGWRLAGRVQVEVVRVRDRDVRRDHGDDDHERDHPEAEARLAVLQEEHYPAGDAEAAADPAWRRGEREFDRGLELRHQPARSRGSRTRLSTSMIRLARITQTESTTRIPCASG